MRLHIKAKHVEASRKLQLIHADICGPITSSSHNNKRTDRGGEFTSKEFAKFCTNPGIFRQLMAAYTPQQNRVAERKNRTTLNVVRAVLHEKEVPKSF